MNYKYPWASARQTQQWVPQIIVWSIGAGGFALITLALTLLPLAHIGLYVGFGIVITLALIDPIWALYAAILSVPIQEIIHLPGGVSYTQATLLLAAAAWGIRVLAHREQPIYFGRIALGLAILLWALALATITTPYSQTEAFKETLRWVTTTLIYGLAVNSLSRTTPQTTAWNWRAGGLIICLLAAPAANAIFGLWQFSTANGPPSFAIAGGRFVRAYGTIGQPNSFAGYMNMAWPLAVAILLFWAVHTSPWKSYRLSASCLLKTCSILGSVGLAALLLLAALLASFSRGGWVGALGGGVGMVIAYIITRTPTTRQHVWIGAGIAIMGICALLLFGGAGLLPEALTQRFAGITRNLRLFDVRTVMINPGNFAVVERMAHLQAAWTMVVNNLLTGVGPGNFTQAYESVQAESFHYALHPWYESRGHAHNYYLHIAAEAGSIGAIAYGLLLLLLLRQSHSTLTVAQGWFERGIAVGGYGIITAVATHNLFENLHVLNMGIQLSALWGLLTAMERNARNI